jgi:CDK-activating kinase assembly factor MAT1
MNKILLKKRGQTKRDGALGAAGGAGGLSIRGLRDKKGPAHHVADDKPYDPYGGVRLTTQRVDLAPEKLAAYSNEWVEITRTKTEFKAGGYSPDEYLSRALFEAFSGLGVFVGEEKPDRSVATAGAREAAATGDTGGKMDVDDPF